MRVNSWLNVSITVYVAMRKLAQWNGETLPVDPLNDAVLSDDDWLELAGLLSLIVRY